MAKTPIAQLGREYWNHGEGAVQIAWGTPGAMTRCHVLVMEHAEMTSDQAWGYCAERHHDVTGKWPIHAGKKRSEGDVVDETTRADRQREGIRAVDFEVDKRGDGLTLTGYAAVFNSPIMVRDIDGDFEEVVSRGAFARSIVERTPVLMFEHGRHPLIGPMPLGVIERMAEDRTGLHVEARLSDNWLIQPVRDAVRDRAVKGMSFRFAVPEGGDTWKARNGKPDLRTIADVDLYELGPVVFPSYEPTTASIRSLAERLPVVGETGDPTDLTERPGTRGAGGGDPRDAGQRDAHQISTAAAARHRRLLLEGVISV